MLACYYLKSQGFSRMPLMRGIQDWLCAPKPRQHLKRATPSPSTLSFSKLPNLQANGASKKPLHPHSWSVSMAAESDLARSGLHFKVHARHSSSVCWAESGPGRSHWWLVTPRRRLVYDQIQILAKAPVPSDWPILTVVTYFRWLSQISRLGH